MNFQQGKWQTYFKHQSPQFIEIYGELPQPSHIKSCHVMIAVVRKLLKVIWKQTIHQNLLDDFHKYDRIGNEDHIVYII